MSKKIFPLAVKINGFENITKSQQPSLDSVPNASLPALNPYSASFEISSPSTSSDISSASDILKQGKLTPYALTSSDDEQEIDELSHRSDAPSNNGAISKLKKKVRSIAHALPIINNEYSPDCVAVRLRSHKCSNSYLQEVSNGKITGRNGDEYYIPPVTKDELSEHRFSYDPTTKKLIHKDHIASALVKTGKGRADPEAFVLSKMSKK